MNKMSYEGKKMKDKHKHFINVKSWILVLAIITKLSNNTLFHMKATVQGIMEMLEKVYGRKLTRRHVERILFELAKQGYIFKRKKLLEEDQRICLFGVSPDIVSLEAFTLVKLDRERSYVFNKSKSVEGLVYDPPPLEGLFAEEYYWNGWDPDLLRNLLRTWAVGSSVVCRELQKL